MTAQLPQKADPETKDRIGRSKSGLGLAHFLAGTLSPGRGVEIERDRDGLGMVI